MDSRYGRIWTAIVLLGFSILVAVAVTAVGQRAAKRLSCLIELRADWSDSGERCDSNDFWQAVNFSPAEIEEVELSSSSAKLLASASPVKYLMITAVEDENLVRHTFTNLPELEGIGLYGTGSLASAKLLRILPALRTVSLHEDDRNIQNAKEMARAVLSLDRINYLALGVSLTADDLKELPVPNFLRGLDLVCPILGDIEVAAPFWSKLGRLDSFRCASGGVCDHVKDLHPRVRVDYDLVIDR